MPQWKLDLMKADEEGGVEESPAPSTATKDEDSRSPSRCRDRSASRSRSRSRSRSQGWSRSRSRDRKSPGGRPTKGGRSCSYSRSGSRAGRSRSRSHSLSRSHSRGRGRGRSRSRSFGPPVKDSGADFEEAAEFSGARPGYVFKLGAHGLGYYRDGGSFAAAAASEDQGFRTALSAESAEAGFAVADESPDAPIIAALASHRAGVAQAPAHPPPTIHRHHHQLHPPLPPLLSTAAVATTTLLVGGEPDGAARGGGRRLPRRRAEARGRGARGARPRRPADLACISRDLARAAPGAADRPAPHARHDARRLPNQRGARPRQGRRLAGASSPFITPCPLPRPPSTKDVATPVRPFTPLQPPDDSWALRAGARSRHAVAPILQTVEVDRAARRGAARRRTARRL